MRIYVLRNLGAGLPPYREGQEVDADDATAELLVGAGLAEPAPDREPASLPAPKPEPPKKTRRKRDEEGE